MATLDHQSYMDKEENAEEKSDKVKILVVLGLDNGDSKSRSICHINLDREDTINFIFTAPTEIPAESAACVHHNDLYTVGVGSDRNEMWRWSAERDDWARLADLPSGRCKHSATWVGEKMYMLGGLDVDARTLDSILCYDINSNSWTQITQLCHAIHSAACVTYKHFIYIFGGVDKNDENVNHVQVYDTSIDEVTLSSDPVPGVQSLLRAVLWGSKALLIGCWTCYIYDFELNYWDERKRFKTDVYQFGLTLNDDTLYISGGGTTSENEFNQAVSTYTDQVKSLSVDDFISDNQRAEWKHHNKIPHPAVIHSYNQFGLEKDISKHPSIGVTHVDVELNGEMRGMTVVDDHLFVVPSEDPVVNVYGAHSLRALYAIYIPDMKDPRDLAGCSHNKVLYISDSNLGCIHKVVIAGGHLNKLRVRENYFPFYLSVTSEHNLLVFAYAGGSKCILLEYTSEGEELREIKRDSSFTTAWPIRELNIDEFIIICCSSGYILCVMNSEGQIIRLSDGVAEKAPCKLIFPRSITVDKKRELVFLTDVGNGRVDMFSTNMTHICQIQVASQKSGVKYTCFDAANDILFIDASTQRITGNQRGAIRGLTVVDDWLFVIHDNHESQVNVFDSFSMKVRPKIYIPDMKNPQDIVGCSHNKVLYISDRELECIHKVNIVDDSVCKWKVMENFKPCGISITSKNNVLIILQRLSEIYEHSSSTSKNLILRVHEKIVSRVVEYTSEGQILREIKLDTHVEKAWQAVELNTNQFLICYASTFPRFSVINSAGQIIRDYNVRKEEEEEDEGTCTCVLVYPHSVTLDKKRELIIASDQVHNRVEIFSTDLTYIGPIQSSRQFLNPTCAYIDTSSDRLFVGEKSGCVVIYLMKQQLLEIEKQLRKK